LFKASTICAVYWWQFHSVLAHHHRVHTPESIYLLFKLQD